MTLWQVFVCYSCGDAALHAEVKNWCADSITAQRIHPDLPKKCFMMNFSCASGGGLLPP